MQAAETLTNFVGLISQTNDAMGEDADNIAQPNQIDISQNLDAVNDCDEQDSGKQSNR